MLNIHVEENRKQTNLFLFTCVLQKHVTKEILDEYCENWTKVKHLKCNRRVAYCMSYTYSRHRNQVYVLSCPS